MKTLRLVVRYIEDANEAKIVKAVERIIEHLATEEDLANLKAVMRTDIANTKADRIKWMFIFWVTQLGIMFGFLYYFFAK